MAFYYAGPSYTMLTVLSRRLKELSTETDPSSLHSTGVAENDVLKFFWFEHIDTQSVSETEKPYKALEFIDGHAFSSSMILS